MSRRVIMMATTCEQVQELLPAYDEGDLEADEVRRLERHLLGCGGCREVLRGLQESWERLDEWADLEPAPAWRQDFWRALGREDEQRRWRPFRFLTARRWVPAAMAATLAVGFFGGTLWHEEPVALTGMAASYALSRPLAQVAMASAADLQAAPRVGEVDGPLSPELLDEALSSVPAR